jgi:3-hydroxyisobutyrate dehydrogenase-like beta-hydroxyacid dehydrogenase
MTRPRIGFIGLGEAAFHIANGLRAEGLSGIQAYDKHWDVAPQSELVGSRARESGVTLAPSLQALVEGADIVICTVSASVAVALARECAKWLQPGQVYADFNSAGPQTKEEIAALIAPTGAGFVDGAVMGTVPGLGHKVPTLICGTGAQALESALAPYGMALTLVEGDAGRASASKMLRSIFMKGVVALLLETVLAGHRYGLEDDLLDSIADTFANGSFKDIANGLMTRGVIHAERRAHEMEEVIATLRAAKVDDTMSQATHAKLLAIAAAGYKAHFGGVAPKDFHDIFDVAY